eukprot:1405043-Lingulodinium_polyedra.AAC.1
MRQPRRGHVLLRASRGGLELGGSITPSACNQRRLVVGVGLARIKPDLKGKRPFAATVVGPGPGVARRLRHSCEATPPDACCRDCRGLRPPVPGVRAVVASDERQSARCTCPAEAPRELLGRIGRQVKLCRNMTCTRGSGLGRGGTCLAMVLAQQY